MKFTVGVWIMEALDWFYQAFSGKTLDTYIEDETLKKTEKMFQSYGFKPIS